MQDLVLVQQALRSQIPPPGPREQHWCYNLGRCIALCIRTGGVFFQRRMEEEFLAKGNGGRRQEKELNEVWLQKEAVLCVTPQVIHPARRGEEFQTHISVWLPDQR